MTGTWRCCGADDFRLEPLEQRILLDGEGPTPPMLQAPPPGVPDLLAGSDTGAAADDDLTGLDNSAPGGVLEFAVGETILGATVSVYADGELVGSAVATGPTTIVTTDGAFDLIDGTHAVTARQTEPGKLESDGSPALQLAVDTEPPHVTALAISSTSENWGLGAVDRSVWLARGPARTAPWRGIDRVVITFDETVTAGAADLAIVGQRIGAIPAASLAGSGTERLEWALADHVPSDQYSLTLADRVEDLAGNALDGDAQGDALPSGNGAAGGSFSASLNVLIADANGDGVIDEADEQVIRDAYPRSDGQERYNILADFDGTRRVDIRDRRVWRDCRGDLLPARASEPVETFGDLPAPRAPIEEAPASPAARPTHTRRSDLPTLDARVDLLGVIQVCMRLGRPRVPGPVADPLG